MQLTDREVCVIYIFLRLCAHAPAAHVAHEKKRMRRTSKPLGLGRVGPPKNRAVHAAAVAGDEWDCQHINREHKAYCFCRRGESGFMLQCLGCNEWYAITV